MPAYIKAYWNGSHCAQAH